MVAPWDLTQDFVQLMNQAGARDRQYTNARLMKALGYEQEQAQALQTHQWSVAKGEQDFREQLVRDEANRMFQHGENWQQSQYRIAEEMGKGGGKADRLNPDAAVAQGPAQSSNSGPPAYQSPLTTVQTPGVATDPVQTSSTGPAAPPSQRRVIFPKQDKITIDARGFPNAPPAPIVEGGEQPQPSQPATGGQPAAASAGAPSAQAAYQYYINKGVNPMVAAGLVGNFDAESSFNTGAVGDNGASVGIGQWQGSRRTNLIKFAQSRGHAAPTFEDQLDFPLYEAETGSDPGAKRALDLAMQAGSPEEAAKWIMMYYERPADWAASKSIGRRQGTARAVHGGQAVAGDTGRRYFGTDPMSGQPQGPATVAPAPVAPAGSVTEQAVEAGVNAAGADESGVITADTLKSKYKLNDYEVAGVPEDKEVIGIGRYSEKALDMLGQNFPDMYAQMYPVSRLDDPTNRSSGFLILRDKAEGDIIRQTQGQKQSTAGTQAPTVEVKNPKRVSAAGTEIELPD